MNQLHAVRNVAFLDTNTLHFIGIYLEYAKRQKLFPWGTQNSATGKREARAVLDNLHEARLKRNLKRGLETVDFLATQDVEVQYSPISELELLTARTKGKAIVSAAKEGIPDRIWSRFSEEEIRDRLTPRHLTTIKNNVDSLTSLLEESAVAVRTKPPEQANDVHELAKSINGLIYMEAMDSIIYATALLAQADYLLTADGYVRDTTNHIHNPRGDARYQQVRRKLQRLVQQMILGDADDIQLPSAHTITADGKRDPDLPASATGRSS